MSVYPRRPKAEAFDNAVDVVEFLLAPTDQVPNVRHLRVLHTFSSMTFPTLLIQQGVEKVDEFLQHDGVGDGDAEVIRAGLGLSTVTI